MKARTDVKRHSISNMHRVGARHEGSDGSAGGGGYPDNCTYFEISATEKKTADVILAELKEMNLRDDLLLMAEKIGGDKFVQLWQVFDFMYAGQSEGRFRISFPSFNKYLKYQRNEFIKERVAQGADSAKIKKELSARGYNVSERTVSRCRAKVLKEEQPI
jgi:hypothetical protein